VTLDDLIPDDQLTPSEMVKLLRPRMHKRHYQMFADAIPQIEQGIIDLHIPMPEHYREQIMELVTARIALVCAKDNDKFDSFLFADAVRKNARHGISAIRGSAPRNSKGAGKRS
jgi:hypothetical protein